MANLTGGGTQAETLVQKICSANLTERIQEQLIYIGACDIFLAITALLGNSLILAALRKETSLHPPSKLLFRCMATTDLCVGLISEPVYVFYLMSIAHKKWNLCRYALVTTFVVTYMLCSVTLLTLAAISVDRLLALLLGLRYRQVVTLKRTYWIVATFWIVSFVAGISYLGNHQITIWYGQAVTAVSAVTSIVSHTKIFLTLRHHHTHVHSNIQPQQGQSRQATPLNIARYRKAVSSVLWVQLSLVACYLPYGAVSSFSYSNLSSSRVLAVSITVSLVFLNSSLNPLLYCWKISEVKQAVKQTIRDALCC